MSEERSIPIDVALFQSLESKSAELSSQFTAQVESIQKQLQQVCNSLNRCENACTDEYLKDDTIYHRSRARLQLVSQKSIKRDRLEYQKDN